MTIRGSLNSPSPVSSEEIPLFRRIAARPAGYLVRRLHNGINGVAALLKQVRVWSANLVTRLTQPDGWAYLAKGVGSMVGLLTIIAAFMSYQSSNLDHEMEASDRLYAQLVADAGSDSVRVRIGAIHRIPRLLRQKVPITSAIGPLEGVRLSLGGHPLQESRYAPEFKILVKNLFAEIRAGNSKDPQREMEALISLLGDLGPDGWYVARSKQNELTKEDKLAWVWLLPDEFRRFSNETVALFEGEPLDNLDFSQFKLEHADLVGSTLSATSFKGTALLGADLTRTKGSKTEFEFARLNGANLTDSKIQSANFDSADLDDVVMTNADLSHSHFAYAHLDRVRGIAAHLSDCKLMDSLLERASLQNAMLDNSDLSRANMKNAELDFAIFTGSTLRHASLVRASLRHASMVNADLSFADVGDVDFTGADLRNANLFSAAHLSDVKAWTGAKLDGVRGLSPQQLSMLMRKGANSSSRKATK